MTIKQAQLLSNEELDLRVAKLLGIHVQSDGINHCLMACKLGTGSYDPGGKFLTEIPRHTEDLSACADFPKHLTEWQCYNYVDFLIDDYDGELRMDRRRRASCALATARQRCEAFVLAKGIEDV